MPEPLNKLGLPNNAILVTINNRPIDSAAKARLVFEEFFAAVKKANAQAKAQQPAKAGVAKVSRPLNANPASAAVPTIQLEYVHRGKALMKEYRLIQ